MQLFVGSDHGGFALKTKLKEWLQTHHYTVEDLGTPNEASCDYPVFAEKVARKVQENTDALGVLVCTTGVGMCICANKFQKIRAALIQNPEIAQKAREHNAINMLCLAGTLPLEKASQILQAFLTTAPSQEARHLRRLQEIEALEVGKSLL